MWDDEEYNWEYPDPPPVDEPAPADPYDQPPVVLDPFIVGPADVGPDPNWQPIDVGQIVIWEPAIDPFDFGDPFFQMPQFRTQSANANAGGQGGGGGGSSQQQQKPPTTAAQKTDNMLLLVAVGAVAFALGSRN